MLNAMPALADPRWYAVLTKPRAEPVAMLNLARQGYECLFPRVRHSRRGAHGMVDSIDALFPRYVFLRADADLTSLAPVRSTRGVAGLVRFGSAPALVPDRVIASIRARSDADAVVELSAPTLRPGDEVTVTEGPLSGLSAIFQSSCGLERVRLLVRMLGDACNVVVPRKHLALLFPRETAAGAA